ncbi:hsp90-like protein [Pluteus cervinus]|uniref:Hsp90-like protein n=1 Tax=Pluteus cervinus TaxID=181527 RepID=A0ACD3BB85_9AGAR|nr:hsp90-like protein [Pluteus cervinus]
MSRLNYSKWDALELSDDSDIEGHPNVDKKSLIRWKQRDIHEKRDARKNRIAHLHAQIACNKVLFPRIVEISNALKNPSTSSPTAYVNSLVEKLEKNPSRDCPPGNNPDKIEQTYDGMMLSLLRQVIQISKDKVKTASVPESERDEKLGKLLTTAMAEHVAQLNETIKKDQKEVDTEEKEQNKKITSDDIHEGFSNSYVAPKADPAPIPLEGGKSKKKEKAVEYEVLNPGASSSAKGKAPQVADDDDEDDEGLPTITPTIEKFAQIGLYQYEESWKFIQAHRDVYVPGAADALLIAAFRAEQEGRKKLAKQCVHQSLLIQYCEKLGSDGPRVLFRKMIDGDPRAERVFVDDVEKTYQQIAARSKVLVEEAQRGREQIQLVPEDPNMALSFNVPDGPPPENLVLEGPGSENVDIEEVRKVLQARWDVFDGFPEDLQEALKTGSLDEVNKVLGDMDVPLAEAIVESLNTVGILSFAEGGIRDETGHDDEE